MVARHGLTELYEPPQGTVTTALIVFVHGLFGHPYDTWASNPSSSWLKSPRRRSTAKPVAPTSSANSPRSSLPSHKDIPKELVNSVDEVETRVFWPRDLLPNIVHDARILTWGYDADIIGFDSASQSTVHQHAGSLLSDLADQREISESYRRPILFVVHCLGGIIVKAALNRSSATHGTRLKDIAPATLGVCFLGTPHRGSSTASLSKIACEISKTMATRPNTKLLQALERNSETLEQIGDTFAQTMLKSAMKLRVYSFREEKDTRKWPFNTMVVKPDSAKIGDPYEETGGIPANHNQMTKFKSSEDTGFKRIAAQLRRWVHEIRASEEISPENITGPNFAIDQFTKDDIRIYTESRLSSWHVGKLSLVIKDDSASHGSVGHQHSRRQPVPGSIKDLRRHLRLQELHDDTLRKINVQYANETHRILQIILHSLKRTSLEILVEATVMSLNRYLDGYNWIDVESTSNTSDLLEASRGPWLMGRIGGLLETYTAEAGIWVDQVDELIPVPFDSGDRVILASYIKNCNSDRGSSDYGASNHLLEADDEMLYRYGNLLFFIAVNSISLVQGAYNAELKAFINGSIAHRGLRVMCLLQATIRGPNIVPADLQDRVAMVKLLLASGYSPNTRMSIPSNFADSPTTGTIRHTSS
ncbi:MAG: hypothetical protein Q9204_004166 [Flavoplaca sp. TL-2023a]